MRLAEPDALELQNAAEFAIAVSDKQRGAIRRNRDAARRAVEVERLGAVEGDGVEDIDDVLGLSGEEDAAPATDGREAQRARARHDGGDDGEWPAPAPRVPNRDLRVLCARRDVDAVVGPGAREDVVCVRAQPFEREPCFGVRDKSFVEVADDYAHAAVGRGCGAVDGLLVAEIVDKLVGVAVEDAQVVVVGAENALGLPAAATLECVDMIGNAIILVCNVTLRW